ncbi:hypothetical protein NKR19_g1936 [Coniochaeta hoffmannii]|uniref:Uncharacterized protein n=1 Tax=Coniochaeta hoffmannii TaxID=91930 RepID=A0AA38RYR1_9PEZI|nr:hypothetical protein NKR19_g1936 [Coniochaeta hoffmannii]
MTPQIVDLESMFWQVRLLVKAAKLMETPFKWSANNGMPKDKLEHKQEHFNRMRRRYRSRIVDRLQDACIWASKISTVVWNIKLLQDPKVGILASETLPGLPGKRTCKSSAAVRHTNTTINSQKYYCSMIVCPSSEEQSDVKFLQDLIAALEGIFTLWQTKAEKSMRLFEHGRLSGRNLGHEAANLAGLGPELGTDKTGITALGKSCLDLAKRLVEARRPTEKLCPGRSRILRWDSKQDIRSAKPRPAPWELSCLAQHLPLNLDIAGSDENRDVILDQCKEFMVTDYTFMASWDASKPTTVGHWWNFITSSVVCAKLLDEEIARREELLKQNHSMDPQNATTGPEAEQVELLRKIYACCKKQKRAPAWKSTFDWRRLKPKMLYHSDTAARSWTDTPQVETVNQKAAIKLRSNIWQFLICNSMGELAETLREIEHNSGPAKLHNISCFDLFLTADSNDLPEISEPVPSGRANKAFWDEWAGETGDLGDRVEPTQKSRLLRLFRRGNRVMGRHKSAIEGSGLMDLYLVGNMGPIERSVLRDYPLLGASPNVTRETLLSKYQESLLSILNSSLVDQGVKYRIIFAKHLSAATLQSMVYLWHPDAIDTFDDHLGDVSNFYDTTVQSLTGSEDTWITGITLKHWRLLGENETEIREAERNVELREITLRFERLKAKEERKLEKSTAEERARWEENGERSPLVKDMYDYRFPPPSVQLGDSRLAADAPWGRNADPAHRLSTIHELGLSLVISGDQTGRSWTCSIVCELFDEDEVAKYAGEVSHTLQMFIHQQATGRQLAFLLLLGYLCERLAEECECFMQALDGIMRYNPKVLLVGMEFDRSDRAVSVLKQMLWGFEALRIFNDKLSQALEVVGRAETKMNELLEDSKSIRHKDMVSGVAQVKEEFEKRRSRLANTYNALQLRVEQGIKLREGISSVLGVEQNESISRLTWLTIIYLGPGLLV